MQTSLRLAFLTLALSGPALAAGTSSNAKPGEWELTVKTTMTGNPIPAASMAQIPPERRGQIMAAMQARSGKTDSHVLKKCVTAEDLKNPGAFNHHDDKSCKKTVIAETATQQKYSVVCTGENPSTGTANFSVDSPTSIHGIIDMTPNSGQAKIHVEETGRWLGDSCTAK